MRTLLALFMALVLSFHVLPVWADGEFIAVYTTMGAAPGWKLFFSRPIDYFYVAKDWDSFDKFLSQLRNRAGKKHIVLDLSVHGDDKSGLLIVEDGKGHPKYTNLGLVCNHIRQYLPEEKVTLILEACFAPICYIHGLNYCYGFTDKNFKVEPYRDDLVPFPIWGIGKSQPNYFRLALEDYLSGKPEVVVDLRQFQDPVESLGESEIDNLKLKLRLYNLEFKV